MFCAFCRSYYVVSIFFFSSLLLYCVKSLPASIHDYMTDSELAYYFHTSDRSLLSEYEIAYLPVLFPVREATSEHGQSEEIDYNFFAFQKPVNLKLRENQNLVSPSFKTYLKNGLRTSELAGPVSSCHYLHYDERTVAAVSLCQPRSVRALVLLENTTLEVFPLNERLKNYLRTQEALVEDASDNTVYEKVPHIIKRASHYPNIFQDDAFPIAGDVFEKNKHLHNKLDESGTEALFGTEASRYSPSRKLTVELAMFFDEPAYKIFAPYMDYDDKKLEDMLLAYINAVQALYHHPSLGVPLDLVLVRLDIFKKQPKDMHHYNGERSNLLDSFCDYQSRINPPGDTDPNHWDMGLYVSGLDFYANEHGKKSGVTMGLATVGGVCLDRYACVIAELGTTNVFGKPYPSAGFTSVYILAHEIGHNLGMHHDGVGNSCPKEGYVMSPSRGTSGETQWSSCSAQVMANLSWATCLQDTGKPPRHLEHNRFLKNPGQIYTAKKQCEILLRDKDAIVSPNQKLSSICYSMQCKTPHRSGYYMAGPALEGTTCGKGQYCSGGHCVMKELPKPPKVTPGGWSDWQYGACNSACIEKSHGFQMNRRHCNNPVPVNSDQGCEGSSVSFNLCDDKKLCSTSRVSAVQFASQRCKEFAKLIPELDPKGAGLQAPHEEARIWMGCAIFCRRADSGSYYTPRIELNDLGVSPYFPDGTWCHEENGLDFYCLQHHCLPENFELTKLSGFNETDIDEPFSQNAHPLSIIPAKVKQYLSLTPDGKPVQKILKPEDVLPKEEDWETDDYIELPENYNHYRKEHIEVQK